MCKFCIIIFLNFLIIYVSLEENNNTSTDLKVSINTTPPVDTNTSMKTNLLFETNASVKTTAREEKQKPTTLRSSLLVTEQRAEDELAEIEPNQVLPLVLFPIFDENKKTHILHFPQNMGDAQILDKRMVTGTEFIIETEIQGIKTKAIKETYFCPKISDNTECLAPQKFLPSEKLQCATEATPVVKLLDQKENKCGPDGTGTAYKVVYNICPNNSKEESPQYETTEMEFYNFCYHPATRKNLHTSHDIISPQLLYTNLLYRERNVKYSMIKDKLTPSNHENSSDSSNEEQNFEFTTLPKKPAYQLQKLVPSEDMAFALWMKTTFEIINFEWQHEKITPLWNKINQYVKKDAIQMFIHSKTTYHIKTAVIDTKFAKFAAEDDDQMSNLWVKMIYTIPNSVGITESYGIAIFMNNFIVSTKGNEITTNESPTESNIDTTDASAPIQWTGEKESKTDLNSNTIEIDTSTTPSTTQNKPEDDSVIDTAENIEPQILSKENELENYCEENLCPVLDIQFKQIGSRARCCPITKEILNLFGLPNFKTEMKPLQISGIW